MLYRLLEIAILQALLQRPEIREIARTAGHNEATATLWVGFLPLFGLLHDRFHPIWEASGCGCKLRMRT